MIKYTSSVKKAIFKAISFIYSENCVMFTNLPRKFEQLSDHLVTGQLQLLASFDIEVPHSSASPDQVSLNSPLTSFPDPRALREKLAIKRNLLLLYQIVVFWVCKRYEHRENLFCSR